MMQVKIQITIINRTIYREKLFNKIKPVKRMMIFMLKTIAFFGQRK